MRLQPNINLRSGIVNLNLDSESGIYYSVPESVADQPI